MFYSFKQLSFIMTEIIILMQYWKIPLQINNCSSPAQQKHPLPEKSAQAAPSRVYRDLLSMEI